MMPSRRSSSVVDYTRSDFIRLETTDLVIWRLTKATARMDAKAERPIMNGTSSQLLAEALRLSEAERSEFAARLIESLDADTDADSAAAWDEEIRRRVA